MNFDFTRIRKYHKDGNKIVVYYANGRKGVLSNNAETIRRIRLDKLKNIKTSLELLLSPASVKFEYNKTREFSGNFNNVITDGYEKDGYKNDQIAFEKDEYDDPFNMIEDLDLDLPNSQSGRSYTAEELCSMIKFVEKPPLRLLKIDTQKRK